MESNPHRWIEALRHSQDRLTGTVRPLTPEQLRGPSYHSWTIAQVLGHMGSQAEIFESWLTAAVDRTEPPGQEFMQPIWDAWNERDAETQATDSLACNERLVERFEGLTDGQLANMHLNLFGMQLDASGLTRLRLAEHSVHTWDIAVALDPTAQVAADAVDLLIDMLGQVAGWTGKPPEAPARLRVHTSRPERDFSLRLGDAVELSDWEGGEADGELSIPAEAFLRLVYGRLDPAHTPHVALFGPLRLDDLRGVFPGV